MKKYYLIAILILAAGLVVAGCGRQTADSSSWNGSQNPSVSVNDLFNVSGAKAIAIASSTTTGVSAIKSMQAGDVTELLKLDASGEISSVLTESLSKRWHPPISVIETGPDGSLYLGFEWGIWVQTASASTDAGKQVAFFRITTDGSAEIVDDSIYGVGTWYGDRNNGELPKKQVQFDGDGNLYYIGKTSTANTILKKKTPAGVISQIGSNSMAVRDFLVGENGTVFFHGSNAGNWSIEWLRVIYNSTVNNIFYNDGMSGWLRSYYNFTHNGKNYLFLVGEGLTLLDQNGVPQKYSGIIRVTIDSTGKPTAVIALYDDNNMYSDTYSSIGDQLVWGYWDPAEMENKKFFATDSYNQVVMPLSPEAGVTEASIRAFIRGKYQEITSDNLDSLAFTGISTSELWRLSQYLTDLVTARIQGKTWAKWRQENDLQGVRFGNAKQLLLSEGKELFAVMSLDTWGSSSSKGDKLFRIVDASGEARPVAYPQDTVNYYKSMSRVRAYRDASSGKDYAIYLSSKVGQYKIYRLDLSNPALLPADMIPGKSNIEIFSFSYNPDTRMLFYDVYDLNDNTSYLAQQEISSTTAASEISAGSYTITDVVPFSATK